MEVGNDRMRPWTVRILAVILKLLSSCKCIHVPR